MNWGSFGRCLRRSFGIGIIRVSKSDQFAVHEEGGGERETSSRVTFAMHECKVARVVITVQTMKGCKKGVPGIKHEQ